jgi:hypothetical protein
MIKVSVWCRRGAFLEAPALYCVGDGALLPGAPLGVGVDYWRPVPRGLGAGLPPSCLVLGAKLWRLGKTAILSQSAAHSVQIGQAVPEAQEKPSVSFI